MKIRRTKADDLFSQFIRRRDRHCQHCGKMGLGQGNMLGLECAHIFSRRHWATRHDPENAVALCFTCHQYFTGNPLTFAAFCRKKYGDARMNALDIRAHRIAKKSKSDEAMRVIALKAMLDET
jgi:hypothetical protein